MQSEFDKEIDSLLREGARRGRATPIAPVEWSAGASEREEGDGVRSTPSGAHLDADEQNAYAENSLPPSARTHYAAHLADCDVCRRSVTQLALAAGIPAQLEQQAAATSGREVLPSVTWRERLGALFAPRAWRYAVPALALLLVSVVTLTVLLRGRQTETSVARNTTTEQAKQQPAAQSETHHASQSGSNVAATPATGEPGVLTAPNSNTPVTKEELAAATAREDQGAAKAGAVLSDADAPPPPPASSVGAAASAPAPVAVAADDPVPMATPMPTNEPSVSTAEVEQKTKVGERAEEAAKDVQKQGNYENNQLPRDRISGPRRNEQSRNVQRGINSGISRDGADKNDVALAKPTPASPPASRRAPPREADEERTDRRASDDAGNRQGRPLPKSSVAETRTVAGRNFRRTGNAWVDTAYNSSQAVTVVRRNSEQYRALIADEPQLRRISDALGGEITVVWKGRAYRIR